MDAMNKIYPSTEGIPESAKINTPQKAIERLRQYIKGDTKSGYAYLGTHAAAEIIGLITEMANEIESLSAKAGPTNGVSLIAAERQRQIEQEGWTEESDKQHDEGELAEAAAVYAFPHGRYYYDPMSGKRIPCAWPWSPKWWKPTPDNRIRELVKAGALIAAEIDRLRAGGGQG